MALTKDMFLCASLVVMCVILGVCVDAASPVARRGKSSGMEHRRGDQLTPEGRRGKRRIDHRNKDNMLRDLGENVMVYAEDDGVVLDGVILDANFEPDVDIASAIKLIYASLSERMDDLQTRLSSVEEKTVEIVNRLNDVDCYDIKVEDPYAKSGIYTLHLDYKGKRPINVYCEMITSGGGWTVIQQRLPRDSNTSTFETNFVRNYHEYQVGFGSPERDYWIGLENIFQWTNSRQYELRIELEDFRNRTAHALYNSFYLEDEAHGYKLHVSGYSGDAQDSLSGDQFLDNFTADGMLFSTPDEDHDTSHEINCSSFWNIGGWWFNRCSWANLNGPYQIQEEGKDCIGINWHKWRNKQCLKATRMMIRPRQT